MLVLFTTSKAAPTAIEQANLAHTLIADIRFHNLDHSLTPGTEQARDRLMQLGRVSRPAPSAAPESSFP